MNNEKVFDVAVVGGGPAGSSTAYHAAKLGLKTILFEKEPYPRDKPCGGALGARCVPLLGENAKNTINSEVRELRLFAPSFKHFTFNQGQGFLVRRAEFDAAMSKDAASAGAEVMDDCRVKSVKENSGKLYHIHSQKGDYSAKYVVLATGFGRKGLVHSPIVRKKYEDDYLAMTVVSETPIDNKLLEKHGFPHRVLGIFFGAVPNGYGWCFVKDGYVNIGIGATAILLKGKRPKEVYQRFVNKLKDNGMLPRDLELAKETAYPLPFKRTARTTVSGNALMVGDLAGFVSPVTGEGFYYSIKGGQLAAQAIHDNSSNGSPLSSYQDMWLKDFGNDCNKYGYFLQKNMYKSMGRMELAVTLGRKDDKMASHIYKLIYGISNYRTSLFRILARTPVSLMKSIF